MMERLEDEDNYVECYVFVDNSNLWIEGQKSIELKDAIADPRYRVDHGKFLHEIVGGREMAKAFLYGSNPPPNDSVWSSARRNNFEVKLFDRSVTGKERAIEPAMACDITTAFFQHQANSIEEAVFIVVTGKLDLKHTIDMLLQQGAKVELWSWKSAMAREFMQLANKVGSFEAKLLDEIKGSFSSTAIMSTRQCNRIKPECAIVFREVPESKSYLFDLANVMHRLMRIFYVTSIPCARGKQDVVFEFPKTKPAVILKLLKKVDLEYEPCDYPTYESSKRPMENFKMQLTNRFESEKVELDDNFYQNLEPFFLAQSIEDGLASTSSEDVETSEEDDCWITVVSKKIDKIEWITRQRQIPCKWKEHCTNGTTCRNFHSDKELELFCRHPKVNFRFWKTRMCSNTSQHKHETCLFAHSSTDSWCLICRMYSHFTSECKFKQSSEK